MQKIYREDVLERIDEVEELFPINIHNQEAKAALDAVRKLVEGIKEVE